MCIDELQERVEEELIKQHGFFSSYSQVYFVTYTLTLFHFFSKRIIHPLTYLSSTDSAQSMDLSLCFSLLI